MMNFNNKLNLISNLLHVSSTKTKNLVYDEFSNFSEIPYKWIDDIKHLEFNELLSSSLGPLSIYFCWNKKQKEKFAEIASGVLSTSLVQGEPLTALVSISALAYKFNNFKNRKNLRGVKWGIIKGGVSVGVFAASIKFMGLSILSFLVGTCAFFAVRKSISIFRLYEYISFIKKLDRKSTRLNSSH